MPPDRVEVREGSVSPVRDRVQVRTDPARQVDDPRAVGELHRAVFGVGVQALVQPRLFEFVGADHAVPVLVPELVDIHVFDETHAREGPAQDPRVRFAGDERRVFHAARAETILGRIHDGQRLVGIGPEPQAVEGQGHAR